MFFAYKKQILFTLTFGALIYLGLQEDATSSTNYKKGLFAAALLLIAQGCVSKHQSPFIKGFEIFWRTASRLTVLYWAFLIFILFQTTQDARQFFSFVFSDLGKPTESVCELSDDCSFSWSEISDSLAHHSSFRALAVWFFSTLMIRDAYYLHFWSLLDMVFKVYWSPEFRLDRTCWYDHVFSETIFTKTPGILLGLLFVGKMGLKEFDWFGRKGKEKLKDWDVFHNYRRFGGVCVLLVIVSVDSFCGFFMMRTLWIRHWHAINNYRLAIWLLLKALSIGELYDDVETWGTEERRKTPLDYGYRLVAFDVALLEGAVSWKFKDGIRYFLDVSDLFEISLPWIILFVSVFVCYFYLRFRKYGDTLKQAKKVHRQRL